MHPNLRKAAVNWIDGMKVNKNHFLQTEDWLIDHLKDIAAVNLTDHSYGLLPSAEGNNASINFQIEIEQTQFLKVTLLSCRAITRGGIRIEITPHVTHLFSLEKNHFETSFNLKNAANQQYDIVVTVDPYQRVPVGEPDADEHPLRHPFAISKYSLDVIPSNHVNTEEFSTYHLTIGKFRVVAGEVQVEEYIPPSTALSSHPALLEFYREFRDLFNDMKQNLTQYIKKSRSLDDRSVNQNLLALAESLIISMAIFQDEFEIDLPQKPPVDLFKFFMRLSRLVYTELNCMPEDERLVVYGSLNQSFGAGTIENTLSSVLNLKYAHRDIYHVITALHQQISKLSEIIAKLPFSAPTPYQKPREEVPFTPEPEAPKRVGSTVKVFRGGRQL
jgi:hypothetical protein